MDGAIEGLLALQAKDFKLIIITNQPLINEGVITQSQYATFTTKMLHKLIEHGVSIFKIKYCPHARNEGCICIKPKTGMIDAILSEYPELNLEQSFFAGDSDSDMELAQTLGIRFFRIAPNKTRSSSIVHSLNDISAYL